MDKTQGESEIARDSLATIPQPQALLETLLQAFYRAPELQFLLVLQSAGHRHTQD